MLSVNNKISMIPGPTLVYDSILKVMSNQYGSGDSNDDFFRLYDLTCKQLQEVVGTSNSMAIMTGEGMVALWGALKSCLVPGDTVLSIGTGVFGDGIASMAASLGCTVKSLSFPYNSSLGNGNSLQQIEDEVRKLRPVMITAVHCETPCGTINPLAELGRIKEDNGIPLLYVDAVASAGGVAIDVDKCFVDLLLMGSQKCFSAPPSMSAISVSDFAWEIIKKVNYQGYDSLVGFKDASANKFFPYTPYWHGIASLSEGLRIILDEGLEKVFERHNKVKEMCHKGLAELGIELYPSKEAISSPTVTAAYIPKGHSWQSWSKALEQEGLIVASTYGDIEGKVFRIGHMGSQANESMMRDALKIISRVI